jgi:hypothetical protein
VPDRRAGRYERAVRAFVDDLTSTAASEQPHLARAVVADQLARAAERIARLEVDAARSLDGATWQQVGDAFGVIKQTAHERFQSGPDGPHLRPARSRG